MNSMETIAARCREQCKRLEELDPDPLVFYGGYYPPIAKEFLGTDNWGVMRVELAKWNSYQNYMVNRHWEPTLKLLDQCGVVYRMLGVSDQEFLQYLYSVLAAITYWVECKWLIKRINQIAKEKEGHVKSCKDKTN